MLQFAIASCERRTGLPTIPKVDGVYGRVTADAVRWIQWTVAEGPHPVRIDGIYGPAPRKWAMQWRLYNARTKTYSSVCHYI